jgi:hypothetical protein
MKARIRLRWWLCAVAIAGALLLLLAVRDHEREARRPPVASGTAPETTARSSLSRALRRWTAATRVASRRRADGSTPRHDDGGQLRHLAELDRTPDEDQLLWAAEEELVAACMARRGFSYLPNAKDDDPDAAPGHSPADRRGDIAAARSRGYGLVARLQQGESPITTPDRNAAALARMTGEQRAAFLEALRGPSISPSDPSMRQHVESVPLPGGGAAYWYRDSCLAEARRRLYGEDYEHNELGYGLASLRSELLATADGDPEYRQHLEAWRDCMRTRGFHEDRPEAAAKRLASDYHAGKLSLDELRTQEVTVATADTECYVAADLARSRQTAEARAEEQLVARNTEKLQAMQRARDEALEHAATVLGSAEP